MKGFHQHENDSRNSLEGSCQNILNVATAESNRHTKESNSGEDSSLEGYVHLKSKTMEDEYSIAKAARIGTSDVEFP